MEDLQTMRLDYYNNLVEQVKEQQEILFKYQRELSLAESSIKNPKTDDMKANIKRNIQELEQKRISLEAEIAAINASFKDDEAETKAE